ncbi:hypothetical protein AAFF_G00093080 [Aldrovandia affinis]|uniref:Uncharacterized protein n=1 Tax=Aldrovandia affinis TaxID=143900 RepID=A0AAD7T2Q1_9TELE|nr:hypothetical protein AAFF_G00093080 [Aldrovandia affinis]
MQTHHVLHQKVSGLRGCEKLGKGNKMDHLGGHSSHHTRGRQDGVSASLSDLGGELTGESIRFQVAGSGMALTPESEASTSTMNWREKSGWIKTGADVKRVLRSASATSTSGVQENGMEEEVSLVKGAATLL